MTHYIDIIKKTSELFRFHTKTVPVPRASQMTENKLLNKFSTKTSAINLTFENPICV